MGHWLVRERARQAAGLVSRFDPRWWTVDFPRPMMAAVTTPAPDAMRVDCTFLRRDDLAGLIWDAADRWSHPLLAYETARDFRECVLSFRWRSAGLMPLDAVNGPVLTIEGRDAGGNARSWYVRLWNYARGTPEDAMVSIDFDKVEGGFLLPDEADPVWAGNVDRMFVCLVPAGYEAGGGALPAAVEAWAELSAIRCEGAGAVIACGDVVLPEHDLGICTAYDDCYNQTPARVLHQVLRLGYRGRIVHYVGMSHYPRLTAAADGEWRATLEAGAINVPCAAWHRAFAAEAARLGCEVVWSLSYELLDQFCPEAWKQRAVDGAPALTGWVPPSTLLSPCNDEAMAYLHAVGRAFVAIGTEAGLAPKFQVGEPWWWTMSDGRPCLYDAAAVAAFAPIAVPSVRGALNAAQLATLEAAGAALAASTAALVAAMRAEHPGLESYLLAYLPTVLDAAAPEARRMNMPVGWASPAFDVLQLEDYDWAAAGDAASSAAGAAAASARLNYPPERQEYLAGFVSAPERRGDWHAIIDAASAARERGVRRAYLWAMPQVARDGLVFWKGEDEVQAFDDVAFPLALGREVEVTPEFSTRVTTSAGGRETRSAGWAAARTRYDAGPGVRSEADVAALLAFYRARLGPARAFRLRDPFDHAGVDEAIGTGDGATRTFALVKRYDAAVRRITRPVAGSVGIKVAGVATSAFAIGAGGTVTLDAAPPPGAVVTASFAFDVPVRFAEDRLTVSRATYLAGEAASVPLVEVREA